MVPSPSANSDSTTSNPHSGSVVTVSTTPKIAAADVPSWLADHGGHGPARIGPLDPALSAGAYSQVFAALQEAIAAGDIYQANLTFPLAGAFRGDPLAIYAALRELGLCHTLTSSRVVPPLC